MRRPAAAHELDSGRRHISSRGTKKSQLKEPDEEKPISPEKSKKCAHTMAFFGRNWLFFVRVKKLAFLSTARRYMAGKIKFQIWHLFIFFPKFDCLCIKPNVFVYSLSFSYIILKIQ